MGEAMSTSHFIDKHDGCLLLIVHAGGVHLHMHELLHGSGPCLNTPWEAGMVHGELQVLSLQCSTECEKHCVTFDLEPTHRGMLLRVRLPGRLMPKVAARSGKDCAS